MAYRRIYIDNLRKKVTLLFEELQQDNRLGQKNFIEAFKHKYPKDYAMLQYEWEFKVHEFKKNRKGNPKPHPIRPDEILLNMYKNYYFKLIKKPALNEHKEKEFSKLRCLAGKCGYKIKYENKGKYDVINKGSKEIEYCQISYLELKELFSQNGVLREKEGKHSG